MDKIKVSIIMPVYNSVQFVGTAIESILNQTFSEYELIIIDDGSKDGSGLLCDEYAAKYPQIKVIHVENQGVTRARNRGIEAASGEYISFCDNDDAFEPTLLEDNYSLACEFDSDIVRFYRRRIEIDDAGIVLQTDEPLKGIIKSYEFEDNPNTYMNFLKAAGSLGIWNAIYKKEFIDKYNIRFDERLKDFSEDCCFNFACYRYMKSAVVNQKVYYNWIQRHGHSMSRIISDSIFWDRVYSNTLLLEYEYSVLKEKYYNIPKEIWTFHLNGILNNMQMVVTNFELDPDAINKLWTIITNKIIELDSTNVDYSAFTDEVKTIWDTQLRKEQ